MPARQPPLQFVAAAVVAPTGPKRPGLHAVPPAHEVAPSVSENRPDSHAVHCRAPVALLYFPRPHALQPNQPLFEPPFWALQWGDAARRGDWVP